MIEIHTLCQRDLVDLQHERLAVLEAFQVRVVTTTTKRQSVHAGWHALPLHNLVGHAACSVPDFQLLPRLV